MKKNGQNYTLGSMTELLTTATRIHLSIRTEFHAVNRTVMALQNLPLFSLYAMDPNPFVACATCHKTISESTSVSVPTTEWTAWTFSGPRARPKP